MTAEELAAAFHEAYERLAPEYGYGTRKATAVPWSDVPDPNRSLMIAVAGELLASLDTHVLVTSGRIVADALKADSMDRAVEVLGEIADGKHPILRYATSRELLDELAERIGALELHRVGRPVATNGA
jgi:hypothetical protein